MWLKTIDWAEDDEGKDQRTRRERAEQRMD